MDDVVSSKGDNKREENSHVEVSLEDDGMSYEYNSSSYNDGRLEHISSEEKKQGIIDASLQMEAEKVSLINGTIEVKSILDCGEHECLQGVKINLYKINGLSPILIKSKITDEEGRTVFSEIQEGCYRIIEIVDKRFFEKPKYINWNEIIIDSTNLNQKIVIVNKIKKGVSQGKHKFA